MAKESIEEVKKDGTRRLAAAKEKMTRDAMQNGMVRKGAILGTAGVYGAMNRFGVPIDVAGFPWKVAVAAVSLVVEATTTGPVQAVAGGVADSSLAIYTERAISTGTLVAGDGYVDDDGDDDDMRDGAAPPDGDGGDL